MAKNDVNLTRQFREENTVFMMTNIISAKSALFKLVCHSIVGICSTDVTKQIHIFFIYKEAIQVTKGCKWKLIGNITEFGCII